MYVKVRSMDGLQTAVLSISKIIDIRDFRDLVEDKFEVPPERQRLFYRGKQMEDGHRLFDYNVNVNDVIQLMVKPILNEVTNQSQPKEKNVSPKKRDDNKENVEVEKSENVDIKELESQYYQVGDLVDAKCLWDNTWWEGKITKIAPNVNCKKRNSSDDGLFYYVKFERYFNLPEDELKLEHIRPRARVSLPLNKLEEGQIVMVNYNLENPEDMGFWYDLKISKVVHTRTDKTVIGTLLLGGDDKVEDCYVHRVNEIFQIENHVLLSDRKISSFPDENVPEKRKSGHNCTNCRDIQSRKCKECGCYYCGGKERPEMQLMCDECDRPFHIFCLDPPLEEIPDVDEWYCPECKNDDTEIVRAGEKLKESRKKAKLASSKNKGNKRDWGKGFACAGRQRVCTLVPSDHFGPIPGVEVGTLWKFRLQASESGVHRPHVSGIHGREHHGAYSIVLACLRRACTVLTSPESTGGNTTASEAGVHRPHVAGIHGREHHGAYSIVLAGGYEDDEDNGDEFTYTGSGGRDLSGNKRTAEQSCDQTLTRMNKALALNCNVPLNKDGAEAEDWKGGKPVRVVRNYKGRKHSKYAPEEGNRYDGIYKIVKYWKSSGKSGFKVWRYLLRRDDPSAAPWTKEGKARSKELGLVLQFPEGYEEAMLEKSIDMTTEEGCEDEGLEKKSRKRKSKAGEVNSHSPSSKKLKTCQYKIEKDLQANIDSDVSNSKLWEECVKKASEGKSSFLKSVEENFACICCQILVHNPVSTPCRHNVCSSCLRRSFQADVHSCPSCRHELGKEFDLVVNEGLQKALRFLFPGYESGR